VIRVVLPQHLRTLARFPTLRGTIRDHGTAKRRDFIRFFACGQDITLDPADDPLPDEIAAGAEPFRVVAAMAGG
jgi:molybdopterin synthase sulfur carrier subunit